MNQALIDLVGDQTGKVCYQTLFGRDTPCPWSVMGHIDQKDACFIQEYHLIRSQHRENFSGEELSIRLPDGTIGKLGHLKDITETRQLELEVKELAARRRAIEDGQIGPIWGSLSSKTLRARRHGFASPTRPYREQPAMMPTNC